jgi:8-oxo-dGTP pyrophosphatase MutT (NUDIX family)
MPTERSAGAVIFRRENGTIKYLLLRKGQTYWDLPKGNIDKGEDEQATAEREVKEETGLVDVKILPNFKEKVSYFYRREGQTVYKEVVFFLAETKNADVKISWEHDDFGWFSYEEAVAKVKSKEIIKKANDFIKKSKSKSLKEFL